MNNAQPILQFNRLIEKARPPRRADRSAAGTLPTRAYRYCHAVTSAAGYGWWVFPPMDFQLIWDGQDIYWHFEELPDWLPLTSAAQFPDFSEAFDVAAPESLQGCAPPFLTVLPEPGMVQVWTGLIVQTAENWSLNVRAPANIAAPSGYSLYEGIIETDRWVGPLFTNLRLTRTHQPVKFRADYPLLQVQPLPRYAYAEETLGATRVVESIADMRDGDWGAYDRTIIQPAQDTERGFGAYAVAARKRGRCPMQQGLSIQAVP